MKILCESPGGPLLKVLVVDWEPRLTASNTSIEVCRNKTTTLCGTPILISRKSEEGDYRNSRKATIGGIIKVTAADAQIRLYAVTAGHVLHDSQDSSSNPDDDHRSDMYSTYDPAHLENYTSHQTELQSEDVLPGAWDFADNDVFSEVLNTKDFVELQDKQPSHDWLLLTIKSGMPNELLARKSPGCFERRELREAARPGFHDGVSEPVIMIGGSHGPKRGELSSLISRVLIGSSNKFVDAYVLTLNNRDGESIFGQVP